MWWSDWAERFEWVLNRRRPEVHGYGDGDSVSRSNILLASAEDEQRRRDRPPPPLAGWCHRGGVWLRWSELDADYVPRPVPASLVEYGEALGEPPEGHTVAMIDGRWHEVPDGAAPLRGADAVTTPGGEPPLEEVLPDALARHAVPPPLPDRGAAVGEPVAAGGTGAASAQRPTASDPSFEEQLAAWRRRNEDRRRNKDR